MNSSRLMILALMMASLVATQGCQEEDSLGEVIPVTSGREVRLIDVITNAPGPDGAAARFRFLVPGLVQGDLAEAVDDMAEICTTYALPRTDGMVPQPQQIIITFAGAVVPFGQAAPDVVQFIEAYRNEAGTCVWAAF
jgi:Family of unknown function (DUF6497)